MGDHADTRFPDFMPVPEKPREKYYFRRIEEQRQEIEYLKAALEDARAEYEELEEVALQQKDLAVSRLARVRELEQDLITDSPSWQDFKGA